MTRIQDEQGRVVGENGVELMDLVIDKELFAIKTISSHTQFLMNTPPKRLIPTMHPTVDERHNEDVVMELFNKRRYTFCSDDEKTRFFHLFSFTARQLGIHVRATQRWVKRQRRILGEEHKKFLLNYIDDNPSAVVTEVVKDLKQNFVDLSVSHILIPFQVTASSSS
ncbi:hypothetical protein BDF14DRAFT_1875385 [Spinellus fusiger]|nr:hypothetical protein BDF14DRAFT_1875385 [Spinellus fusiger]